MNSVLIVKLAALGDIAVASATARAIRARHPSARIAWLTGTRGAELVQLFPEVDEVIVVDDVALFRGSFPKRLLALLRTWARLLGRRFDRILVMHADRRYRLLTALVRARRVDAFSHGRIPLLDSDRAAEYVRLFAPDAASAHVEVSDVGQRFQRTPRDSATRTVVLVPGGARNVLRDDSVRRWPIESYRRLAERLIGDGFRVVVLGDANDHYVRQSFSRLDVVDQVGKQSIYEALQTIRDADFLVTHDTGPLHFARLVRTPALGIFGPTDPRHVVGSATDIVALWGGEGLPCRPCYDGRDFPACLIDVACMRDVSVDRVMLAIRERLGHSGFLSEHLEDTGDTIQSRNP